MAEKEKKKKKETTMFFNFNSICVLFLLQPWALGGYQIENELFEGYPDWR